MSLHETKSRIITEFNQLGDEGPSSEDNRASIAFEFFVADTLASLADKRKKQAKEAAKSAGINVENDDVGIHHVYENEHMTISEQIKTPAERLDKTALMNALTRELGREKAQAIIEASTKQSAAAHSFLFAVK